MTFVNRYEFMITFAMFSYNLWKNTFFQVLVQGYISVVVPMMLYKEDIKQMRLILRFFMQSFFLIFSCLTVHMILSWIGF